LSLFALLGCSLALFSAAGSARADEPTAYAPPLDRALEPELPEMAQCSTAAVPAIEEEEAEGEVEPIAPELRELGHLRLEQQEACKAQTDRLDRIVERLWWVTAQTLALDRFDPAIAETNEWLEHAADRDVKRNEDLQVIRDSLSEPDISALRAVFLGGYDDNKPIPVSGLGGEGDPAESAQLVSSIESAGEATQMGLYLLAGLMVGFFMGYLIWRTVNSGT